MALKQFNPTSPGRRFMSTLTFDEITKDRPEKSLTEPLRRTGGREPEQRGNLRRVVQPAREADHGSGEPVQRVR